MIDFISDSTASLSPVYALVIVGILTGVFLYLEFKRKSKYILMRLTAVLLVSVSLLGILLKPTYEENSQSSGFLLLTPAYKIKLVDSLLNIHPELKLLHTKGTTPYKNSQLSESNNLSGKKLHYIAGEGFSISEINTLPSNDFTYLPASLPEGIVELTIPDRIHVNTKASLLGKYHAASPTTLLLSGPGGAEDSIRFETAGVHSFTLAFVPKLVGNFIYSLKIGDTDVQEKLPLNVLPERTLNILILQSAPGFELKQLKNYLAENHHRITSRSQLSKNNFRYEYSHTSTDRLNTLTTDLLSKFDILIIESSSLSTLSTQEVNALDQAVRKGLGLLLLINTDTDTKKNITQFVGQPLTKNGSDTVTLTLDETGRYNFRKTRLEIPEHPALISHLKKGKLLISGYHMLQRGKVGFILIQETYRLSLEGKSEAYAAVWNPLIRSTARITSTTHTIHLAEPFPLYPRDQLTFKVLTTQDIPTLKSEGVTIAMQEDVLLDNQWYATAWASQTGWHTLTDARDSSVFTYYVTEQGAWSSLRKNNQMTYLKSVARGHVPSDNTLQHTERRAISLWIFYCLFLLSYGFLWLAPKL